MKSRNYITGNINYRRVIYSYITRNLISPLHYFFFLSRKMSNNFQSFMKLLHFQLSLPLHVLFNLMTLIIYFISKGNRLQVHFSTQHAFQPTKGAKTEPEKLERRLILTCESFPISSIHAFRNKMTVVMSCCGTCSLHRNVMHN